MSKTRVINGTLTMTLIALLLLSTLGVLFLSITPVAASPGLTVTPSSGKVKTTFNVAGTGFGNATDVGIGFGDEASASDTLGTGDGVHTLFTGSLTHGPVKPNSLGISTTVTPNATYSAGKYDNGTGTLVDITPSNVQYSDNVYEATNNGTDTGDIMHIFNFTLPSNITKSMVTNITVNWEGMGNTTGNLWLYNFTSNTWVDVGDVLTSEATVSNSTTAVTDYIEDVRNTIWFKANITISSSSPTTTLYTDTVWVVVEAFVTASDDGLSGIIGNATGTINYATKAFSINFTYPVKSNTIINGTYTRYAYDVTPTPVPTTDCSGNFTTTCEVPWVATGTYDVTAIDEVGHKETASFTVDPGITLVPSRGVVGSPIIVYGSGFSASEDVWIYFDATLVNSTAKAESDGTLNATFTVPTGVSTGTHEVTALGKTSGNSYTATFTVPTLSITLSPTCGPSNSTVTVTGEGFTRFGLVRIYFDGTNVKSTAADTYGNITASFRVPITIPGPYTVKANDASTGNNVTASFTIPTPSITLNPTCGLPNSTVTVTGANFTIGGTVGIYFDSTFAGNLTGTVNETGCISGSVTVPSLVPATYNVKGKDWSNGAWSTPASFTVPTPSITLSPTWGPPGTTVTVSGGNFTVNGTVGIYFDSTPVANFTANSTGGIPADTNFTVPNVLPGTKTVTAKDNATSYNVTASFTVPTPTIQLSPEGGSPGTVVTVTGGNFTVNGEVRIYFDATSVANVTTNSTGGIPADTNFTVPAGAAIGAHTVRAYDVATTYNATATFTVGPVIDIRPNTGPPGTNVIVTGSGFTVNQTVEIYFDTTLVKTVNASSTGEISTWFLVPDATAGTHNVKAYDVNTTTWTPAKTFTVSTPSITLSAPQGYPGDTVTITGLNFKLNATVTIYFAGTQWGVTVTANSTGGFTADRIVPDKLAGNYTVSATDGVNTATAWFVIKSTAGGMEQVIAKLDEIEAKLEQYGSFWNFTNNWFTTISNKLGDLGTDTVASLLYSIKNSVSVINWTDITAIKTAVQTDIPATLADVEDKLDALLVWGTLVTKNWTDLTGYIDSAKSEIIAAMPELDLTPVLNELGNETYGLAAIKNAISDAQSVIVSAIGSAKAEILTAIRGIDLKLDGIGGKLDSFMADADLRFTQMMSEILAIDNKLGTFTGADTVASLLHEINGKLDELGMVKPVQFSAGSYSTTKPTSANPVNLEKSSKVTLTVRVRDDMSAGFRVTVYIQNGASSWQPLTFIASGASYTDCATTVEFTTGANGKFYFDVTGATFTAFIYSAESAP